MTSDDKKRKISVLLIEDDEGDRFLVQEVLSQNAGQSALERFELNHAETLALGLERLAKGDIDIVLLDLTLPDSRGIESLHRVRTQSPHTPVVILSALNDESLALDAVRSGASDYLVKGQVEFLWLTRIMRYAIERKQAELETKRLYAELEGRLDLLKALLDNQDDAILVADHSGKVILANIAARELTGLNPTGFGPAEWDSEIKMFQPDMKTPLSSAEFPLWKAIQGEAVENFELYVKSAGQPKGRSMWSTAHPLKDVHGTICGCVARLSGRTARRATPTLRPS